MDVVPLLECLDQLLRRDPFGREAQASGVCNLAYGPHYKPGAISFCKWLCRRARLINTMDRVRILQTWVGRIRDDKAGNQAATNEQSYYATHVEYLAAEDGKHNL